LLSGFFIIPPFKAGGDAGADDADCFAAVGVRFDKQSARARHAKAQKADFCVSMIGVQGSRGEIVFEYRRSFIEGHAVLLQIDDGLG
jgi:hypothetical protein